MGGCGRSGVPEGVRFAPYLLACTHPQLPPPQLPPPPMRSSASHAFAHRTPPPRSTSAPPYLIVPLQSLHAPRHYVHAVVFSWKWVAPCRLAFRPPSVSRAFLGRLSGGFVVFGLSPDSSRRLVTRLFLLHTREPFGSIMSTMQSRMDGVRGELCIGASKREVMVAATAAVAW